MRWQQGRKMHHRKLFDLMARNARKGEFRAEGNTIYVYDVIVSSKADAEWFGGVDAESFVQTLAAMQGPVTVRLNSPGGDVFAGRAMAAAIRGHDGEVTVRVDGYAASAASFITSAADRVEMAEGAMIMIHKAWTLALGNADDFLQTADLLEKIDGSIADTYAASARRRGVEPLDFAALMSAETWFTTTEAIAAGLADAATEEAPQASLRWDLSAYARAPVAEPAQPARDPETPPEPEAVPANETEPQARPNLRADLLLRPAA